MAAVQNLLLVFDVIAITNNWRYLCEIIDRKHIYSQQLNQQMHFIS
jgi:hypothetical protein